MLIIIAKTNAVVVSELSFFPSFFALKLAPILEIIRGSPLETIVNRTIKIEVATWYKPNASAPTTRERYILKKKPAILVSTEKNVMSATVLNYDFISHSYTYIFVLGWMKF